MVSTEKRKWWSSQLDDAESSNCGPKRLKCLSSNVKYAKGNNLLHQFVLDNSYPNKSGSESYINAVLLSFSGTYVNEYNEDGYTPLHLAVLKENKLMVKNLLSCIKNIDIDLDSLGCGNTALHLVVRNLIPELRDKEAEGCGPTVNMDIAKLLLENGADTEEVDVHGQRPLMLLTMFGKFEFASLFCERGANVSSPLLCQRIFRHPRGLKWLLDRGADVNRTHECYSSPLSLALRFGHSDAVKLLLDRGANVNASESDGSFPLHVALNSDKYMKMLINRGANVNAMDNDYRTPLHTAVLCRYEFDVIKNLVDAGADINSVDVEGFTPFHYSVKQRDPGTVLFLITRGANVKTTSNNGETVLHSKTVLCRPNYIKLLVNKGADVNARDSNGCTPLHCAAKLSEFTHPICPSYHFPTQKTLPLSPLRVLQIFISLVDLGAEINSQDEDGNTFLHYVCEMGIVNRSDVELLIEKGASVNIANKNGVTPLELAEKMNLSDFNNV